MKFIGLIWNLNLDLNICFELCTFMNIYLFGSFLFCMGPTTTCIGILLVEYGFVTHGELNFMKEKEIQGDIELVVGLLGYTLYFPLLFGFISIGFYKYSFVYVYLLCIKLNIKLTRNFV